MSTVIASISISLDGFIAGPEPTAEDPLGAGGEQLHEWMFSASAWHAQHGTEGGEENVDSKLTLHIVPVLLGSGRRLFDGVGRGRMERTRLIESPSGVSHIVLRH